jgi:hypothetical protein
MIGEVASLSFSDPRVTDLGMMELKCPPKEDMC